MQGIMYQMVREVENPQRRKRQEARWDAFLRSLKAWELHALMARSEANGDSMELFLHDQYIDGAILLRDVRAAVERR